MARPDALPSEQRIGRVNTALSTSPLLSSATRSQPNVLRGGRGTHAVSVGLSQSQLATSEGRSRWQRADEHCEGRRTKQSSIRDIRALLFDKDTFAQVLEGDRTKVTQLFIRICSDSRHTDIRIVEAKSVTDRKFADWAMALIANPAASPVGPNFISGDAVVEMMVEQLQNSDASLRVAVPVW